MANPRIIEWLREQWAFSLLMSISFTAIRIAGVAIQPVIFRATDQWFVSMDKNDLRTQALKAINEDVQWVPEWAKNRIGSMVAERPDWCISAPALLGRAHSGLQVREVRQYGRHGRDFRCGHQALRREGLRCLVHRKPSKLSSSRYGLRGVWLHRSGFRIRYLGRLVGERRFAYFSL